MTTALNAAALDVGFQQACIGFLFSPVKYVGNKVTPFGLNNCNLYVIRKSPLFCLNFDFNVSPFLLS
jgi:hypothetical protein